MPSLDDLVTGIAQSIATMEGFYKPGSVSQRNNNPGNLRSWGMHPMVDGYAKFPDPETGWKALQSQVSRNINRNLTLTEFFAGKPGVYGGFSPVADKNRPAEYALFVAGRVGIPPDKPIKEYVA